MLLRKGKRRFTLLISCVLACAFLFAIFRSISNNKPVPTSSKDSNQHSPTPENQKEPEAPRKVFVIGLSKTGTTSIGDALDILGYNRIGWEDTRSRFLFRSYLKDDLSPFISLTNSYDAFEDVPWALVYRDMARLYPDAKFILTLRKSEEDWLRSIKVHTARRKWIGHEAIYGGKKAEGNEDVYLDAYRNHTASVRKYFAGRGNEMRLLEWIIDGENGDDEEIWGTLLRFLGFYDSQELRISLGEFPWANRSGDSRNDFVLRNVFWVWDEIMYYLEEVLWRILQCLGWLMGRMT